MTAEQLKAAIELKEIIANAEAIHGEAFASAVRLMMHLAHLISAPDAIVSAHKHNMLPVVKVVYKQSVLDAMQHALAMSALSNEQLAELSKVVSVIFVKMKVVDPRESAREDSDGRPA